LRKLGRELPEVSEDRGEAEGEEDSECERSADDQDDDGNGARGTIAAKAQFGDASDDWSQHHGEEGADVDDLQLFKKMPCQIEGKKDGDSKEDVTAYCFAGFFVAGVKIGRRGGQLGSPVGC
jgi:hypothetical protein